MGTVEISVATYAKETLQALRDCGCLLVAGDLTTANVMTIGWGLIGPLWSKPFFIIAVRPSRYTYEFIERTGEFTVNVLNAGMENIAEYCGSVSGRDVNKFTSMNLTLDSGKQVNSPVIRECRIHYECQVKYKTELIPAALSPDIAQKSYANGDYHTLYYGEIVSSYQS
jgi:flavin reductase (DIM6/NTAB) family NADH-FMN oxidoreductase RutF